MFRKDVLEQNVKKVLEEIGLTKRLNARYVAKIQYLRKSILFRTCSDGLMDQSTIVSYQWLWSLRMRMREMKFTMFARKGSKTPLGSSQKTPGIKKSFLSRLTISSDPG